MASDPRVSVSLYERGVEGPLPGQYQASRGFRAVLNDTDYVCRGTLDGQERESQVFYVYSIIGNTHTLYTHTHTLHTHTHTHTHQ